MATDKFPQAVEGDSILTADNNDRDKLTIGNVVPRMTEAEILGVVTADTDIIVFNTTTNMLEFWNGTTNRRILG
jgi:hypothetical protein